MNKCHKTIAFLITGTLRSMSLLVRGCMSNLKVQSAIHVVVSIAPYMNLGVDTVCPTPQIVSPSSYVTFLVQISGLGAMETNGSVMSLPDGEKTRLSSVSNETSTRYGSIADSLPTDEPSTVETTVLSPRRSYITVAVLCYVNLINYMDRYTIAGESLSALPLKIANTFSQACKIPFLWWHWPLFSQALAQRHIRDSSQQPFTY